MQCPRCQQENPSQAKFCLECGARVALTCTKCGRELPASAKFCLECGTPVVSQATAEARFTSPEFYTPKHLAEKILTSKTALEGERKQVTVLFADLKGSMELLADRDPEEARNILDPVLEHMMEAVHRYEGTVNQVMGDGIMALFGAPLAHEDHAVRACYAALRMQDVVKRYAEDVRRAEGVPIQIRVGLNAGEVVVRSIGGDLKMDYTAVGQTTHLAARMEQLATPGSILMTAEALRLAEGYVEVKPLGPVNVKGVGGPLEVYEVTGAGPVRTRLQASAARGLTRFVGRDAEVEQLRNAQGQARAGRGQVVAVVGEPGVGKSRLFYEFLRSHRTHGWLVLESSSVSYGKATSYLPVIDLLRGYFRIETRDDTRAVRAKVTGTLLTLDRTLEDAIAPALALLDALPAEDEFLALDPVHRRQRTLGALKRLLLRESQVQPLLLVFEDLHWIDTETQAVLDTLVDSLPSAPLLLCVNYRPEYQHGWGSKTYYRQLRIDPLPPETAGELLRALVGEDAGLRQLKQVLIERTEGNPFFLEESVRTLVETGALAGERGRYRVTRAVEAVQLPASVQAVLAARIDRPAPEDKRLLQTAAVIGTDVPFALLQAIVARPEEDLRAGLARLQGAEFLYEASLFPELQFTFKHVLTLEVAYGSLLGERRRDLHARIVHAIEQLASARLEEEVERLARHAFRGEVWDKAVGYLHRAGSKAAARSAHREAVAAFEQALVALEHLPETRAAIDEGVDLRTGLAHSVFLLGDVRRSREVLEAAEPLARGLGDRRRLAEVVRFLGDRMRLMGEFDRAIDYFEQALGIVAELEDPGLQAALRFTLGMTHHVLGDYRQAVTFFRETLTVLDDDRVRERSGRHANPAPQACGHLARSLAELGEFPEAIRAGEAAVRMVDSATSPFSVAQVHLGVGAALLLRGAFGDAVARLEQGLALCELRELGILFAATAAHLALAYARSERLADSLRLLDREVVPASIAEYWAGTPRRFILLGEACLLTGRADEAARLTEAALAWARQYHQRGDQALALHLIGEIASRAELAAAEQAGDSYREARALAEELGMRPLVAHCHFGLGKLHKRTGNQQQAQEHLTTATTMYREMDMRFWLEQAEAEFR
jgi:class 3 adenylate cyclase/tetratricopeptide (TPR) repeat protein